MLYTIHGLTLACLGLAILSWHSLELMWDDFKLLWRVDRQLGFIKAGTILVVAGICWFYGAPLTYEALSIEQWAHIHVGDIIIFRGMFELLLVLLGAVTGAVLSSIALQIWGFIYDLWCMLFLKLSGFNLKPGLFKYQRSTKGDALPPAVIGTGFGGGRSPSQVAQQAIAKMEAEKKAAADSDNQSKVKARAVSTKAGR